MDKTYDIFMLNLHVATVQAYSAAEAIRKYCAARGIYSTWHLRAVPSTHNSEPKKQ